MTDRHTHETRSRRDRFAATAGGAPWPSLMADLDAMAHFALDHRIAAQLQTARRRAGAHLLQRASPSAHWINWAPVGLALVLVVITSWSLLADNAQSLDADLLADALPFDAYLDADFEAAVREDTVQLLEN